MSTCVCPQATAASCVRWTRTSVRQAPASTRANACSAPTRPSTGAPRPPSRAPSASAMLLASCAAALQALRVSSLPLSRAEGPPVFRCTRRDGWGGFWRLSLGLSLSSYNMGPSRSRLALRAQVGTRLGLLQGTTAAWTWTSVPPGHASVEAAAKTCPTAFGVTAQVATQVLGGGVGTGAGQGQSWWVWGGKAPLADVWRLG